PRKGYFVAVFDDITKRKKYEDALRVSEEKYRQLYESSRDAIMTLKPPTWRFTAGNPAAVRMFGCKNESQFVALTPYEFSPKYQPDGKTSNQKAIEMINKAMKEGSNFFEWTHRTLKGEDFYATVLLTRIELKNGMQSLQATVRNITTQKLAQEKVRQLALFLDENPDPVLRVDRSNTIVYANDASKGLLKMLKCAIGKKVPKFCNPMIKKAFKTREKKTTEVQVEDNIFQLIIIPLPDKDFVYLYVQDITEQKFAEEKLQKAYESLKKKTEELERFSKFTVGRELRMIELKKKLRER
ncbi:MAG: PAS domain S-box protein, partial [Candidatus Nanoarchaeia archaeon]